MFADGSPYVRIYATPQGPIEVFADVHIFGKHLVLDEIMVYPANTPERLSIGARITFFIFRQIRVQAATEDFDELTVVFHRTGKKRIGPIMTFTRRLK